MRHTVTRNAVTTTADPYGDGTTTTSTRTIRGLLFAPEGVVEGDGNSPTVVGDATLYGVMPAMDSDDTVQHPTSCCNGEDFAHGLWLVVGGSRGWGSGRKATPIRRTASA